jgi:chromate transport protein ChrA
LISFLLTFGLVAHQCLRQRYSFAEVTDGVLPSVLGLVLEGVVWVRRKAVVGVVDVGVVAAAAVVVLVLNLTLRQRQPLLPDGN